MTISEDRFHDLLGELGREVFYLLDDCETSGPVGSETHTITKDGLDRVSAVLDKIEALPVTTPAGLLLGPGAILQHALTELLGSARDAVADKETDRG